MEIPYECNFNIDYIFTQIFFFLFKSIGVKILYYKTHSQVDPFKVTLVVFDKVVQNGTRDLNEGLILY